MQACRRRFLVRAKVFVHCGFILQVCKKGLRAHSIFPKRFCLTESWKQYGHLKRRRVGKNKVTKQRNREGEGKNILCAQHPLMDYPDWEGESIHSLPLGAYSSFAAQFTCSN